MDIKQELLSLIDAALHLGGRAAEFSEDTPLLGSLPEMDSMGVMALITSLEEHFGFSIEDDEIDGSVFMTVATLSEFVSNKLN